MCPQKAQDWSHEFRFRRALHGAVQVNVALQFALLISMRLKLPIEVYRCIRSFLERGVVVQDLGNYPVPVRRAVDAQRRYSQQALLLSVLRTY